MGSSEVAARLLQIANATRDTTLATAAWRADNPGTRLVGLLGRARLSPGEGLHILPCTSIHTWFIRFPIDVLYLDKEGRVVKALHAMSPFRFSWGARGARSVLELPGGTITATQTGVGDQLVFREA